MTWSTSAPPSIPSPMVRSTSILPWYRSLSTGRRDCARCVTTKSPPRAACTARRYRSCLSCPCTANCSKDMRTSTSELATAVSCTVEPNVSRRTSGVQSKGAMRNSGAENVARHVRRSSPRQAEHASAKVASGLCASCMALSAATAPKLLVAGRWACGPSPAATPSTEAPLSASSVVHPLTLSASAPPARRSLLAGLPGSAASPAPAASCWSCGGCAGRSAISAGGLASEEELLRMSSKSCCSS
mmetsp:Transcript_70502/g.199012  ORF Transcript_70502/g.199012 Transcript_70502/m.199012 type:complete len:244 (+) Transcript_70502:726-1457(+)